MGLDNLKIIGHRGKGPTSAFTAPKENGGLNALPANLLPENTIAAFEKAIDEGADGIELDVFLSKENTPIVIHDNELNRNVLGAKRKDTDLGNVENFTDKELKKFDLGRGNKIPTLEEVIQLVIRKNKGRKNPIVLNIEFKGPDAGKPTLDLINKYVEKGLLSKKSVMYTSFNHHTIKVVRELDKDAQISPCIKTTLLYGEENVEKGTFRVINGAKYDPKGLAYLEQLHHELNLQALDCVLWDMEDEFIELAIKLHLNVYASTSDFRVIDGNIGAAYTQYLLKCARMLNENGLTLFFKTDEAGGFRKTAVSQLSNMEMDLSDLTVNNSKTLKEVPTSELTKIPLMRDIKPDKPYSQAHLERVKEQESITTETKSDTDLEGSNKTPSQ